MGIPVLNESCLGCCSIRTGARIISWFTLIFSVIAVIILFIAECILISKGADCYYVYDIRILYITLAVYLAINLLIEVLLFVFAIANLYGINKGKRNFMVPYLIVYTISVVLQLIGCIALVIIEGTTSSLPVVGCSVFIGLEVYLVLIVYSFFRQMNTVGNNVRVEV